MEAAVDNFVRPALEAWLNTNKTAADAIVGRIVLAAQAREASRAAATEVKRKAPGSRRLSLPGKLADCKSTDLRRRPNCSSSRATRPAARRSRAATTTRRPCCRCAGKILNCEGLATAKVLGEPGDRRPGHRDRHRRRREVQHRRAALRQDHPADGRRRRRLPHHHADARLLLPPHARADQQGPRVHRPAAAVPHQRRQGNALGARTTSTRKRSVAGLRRRTRKSR